MGSLGDSVKVDPTVGDSKKADLAGPGIGNYDELRRILPSGYASVLTPKDTQIAVYEIKKFIEDGLNRELNLVMVTPPLIVDRDSGVNDMLDRDGSRTPIPFHIKNDNEKHPIEAQVVQAATKWKRLALKQFGMEEGEGINTDMKAVRKDYFLDHDHSAYVDQWDWELAMARGQRSLEFLKEVVQKIWKVLVGAEEHVQTIFPQLAAAQYPNLPKDLVFIHAEDILKKYPNLPRKERETAIAKEHGAVFIIGIGWKLEDGFPHEMRAADYDDWSTEVTDEGRSYHGLNGDILVWNHVTQRRHELSSMGIRVDGPILKQQLAMCNQSEYESMPYHRAIIDDKVPLSVGGGIGQSRTYMLLLRKAHIGEVSVTVWPKILKDICRERNIHVLE